MIKAENLPDLFERGLEFAYDCEQQLMKALPKMAEAVSSVELKNAFEQHLAQTMGQADRLHQIFVSLGRAATADTNHAIQSILNESEKLSKHIDRSPLLDAALIANANQWEHYQIALYGSLCSFARTLELHEFAGLLEQTLGEEKTADQTLTQIAETSVNREAAGFHNSPHGFAMI
jgi:ferritin-like metal-binding protein YciE